MANMKEMIIAFAMRIRNMLFFHGYGHIGSCSYLLKPMRIIGKKYINIGDHCSILHHARIEVIRQWENKNCQGCLNIGNHSSIEQRCHIIAANQLNIGHDCVISADVYIADCNHKITGINKNIMVEPLEIKKTSIGNYCFLGIGVKILPGVTIGDNVIVGANSVVNKDVESNTMVAGNPAKIIKKFDTVLNEWVKV